MPVDSGWNTVNKEISMKVQKVRVKKGWSNKAANLIRTVLPVSDTGDIDGIDFDLTKGKAKKLAEKLAGILGYKIEPILVKICPECGSRKVTMFTSDDDMCGDCGKYFPAIAYTDLSKL